jgi:hypothetical protein
MKEASLGKMVFNQERMHEHRFVGRLARPGTRGALSMFTTERRVVRSVSWSLALAVLAASAAWTSEAAAQFGFGRGFGAVGGVSINPQGVLENTQPDVLRNLREARQRALKQVPGDLNAPNDLRKISLRQLQATLVDLRKNLTPLPNEMRILGGLQRVEYVFVLPEEKDIILAGFGEGSRIDERGNIVGLTTGRPVVLLEDLLVALRSAEPASRGGISCSIDPTPEGMRRLHEYVNTLTTIGDPEATVSNIEQQLGPQTITLQGVSPSSHFAQVLVAADYRMKRIAMKFDPPPVKGLSSYLDMIGSGGGRGIGNMQPRWWMATNYDPLLTDAEGLSWQLRGQGVKTMTEDAFFAASGQRVVQAGKTSPAAQKWADNMTEKFGELCVREPIFGELRNCMDLAVVAALIFKENLAGKADLKLTSLLSNEECPVEEYVVPRQTDSKCTFVKKGGNWVISASGGVLINPFAVIEQREKSDSLVSVRGKAVPAKDSVRGANWWSN